MYEPKFKKGDIVEVVVSRGWVKSAGFKVGDIATVTYADEYDMQVLGCGYFLESSDFQYAKNPRYLSRPCKCDKGCSICNGTGFIEHVIPDNNNSNDHGHNF